MPHDEDWVNSWVKTVVEPDLYEEYRYGGSTVKDEKRSIDTMLRYFSDYLSENQLRENVKRHNLQAMLEVVKKYFLTEYDFDAFGIVMSNRYQKTINSYIDLEEGHEFFIHIDELFESTVMGFLIAMFNWSKHFDNLDTYGECLAYVLYLMNDVSIFGKMQEDEANQALLKMLDGDIQILQLAEDCYWTIVTFTFAHEIAHAYLASIGKKYTKQHPEKLVQERLIRDFWQLLSYMKKKSGLLHGLYM